MSPHSSCILPALLGLGEQKRTTMSLRQELSWVSPLALPSAWLHWLLPTSSSSMSEGRSWRKFAEKRFWVIIRDWPYISLFSCALSCGVGGGIIIAGLITIKNDWRMIYWVATALIGAATLLVIFTFPETNYNRSGATITGLKAAPEHSARHDMPKGLEEKSRYVEEGHNAPAAALRKRSYWQDLRIFTGTYTQESFWKLFIRPVILLCLPPVLWATLVMSVTIGFLVAISSNFASAFETVYHFKPWQSGLCFIASIIGSLIAIFFGGHLSDQIADYFTRRNGGIREPEWVGVAGCPSSAGRTDMSCRMRLPALAISVVTGPLALILYGVGIEKQLHWMCATVGLGLCKLNLALETTTSWPFASKFHYRAGHKRDARIHDRRLSSSRRRDYSDAVRLQMCVPIQDIFWSSISYWHRSCDSGVWVSSVVLHQSLDCWIWLPKCIRYHGRY